MLKYVLGENFTFRKLPDDDIPKRKCRAIISGISVKEYTSTRGLGDIEMQFLVLIPSQHEAFIYEKTYSNWSIKGGIEAAFDCLLDNNLVECFEDLLGTVFDAEIWYGVSKGELYAELILKKMILAPQVSGK